MALVKFGGGIIEMRGAIAGTVFSRNSSGNYARAKTTPINPNSEFQQAVRAAVAFLTDRWAQTLTANQRAAWNLYAANVTILNRLGESINISGFNHYIRSNSSRKVGGQTVIDDGPVIFEIPAQDPEFACTAKEDTQHIVMTCDTGMDWSTEDGAYLYIYQGIPQNAQINFFAGPWRWIATAPGIDPGGTSSPANLPAVFAISEGQRLWIYGRISRADGRLSEKFRADCFCEANGV